MSYHHLLGKPASGCQWTRAHSAIAMACLSCNEGFEQYPSRDNTPNVSPVYWL